MPFVRNTLGATLLLISSFLVQAGTPLFTADYYLANPNQWLGKSVSLSVSHLQIPNVEKRKDGLKVLIAYTSNGGEPGGNIGILCSQREADRLISLCGTNFRNFKAHKFIQGMFTEDKEPLLHKFHYFLLIK
jgi:hypothetical protein